MNNLSREIPTRSFLIEHSKAPSGLETYRVQKEGASQQAIYIPGWGDSVLEHPMVHALAQNDLDTTGISLPRRAGSRRKNLPHATEHKIATLLPLLHGTDLVVGHSEGATIATRALYRVYSNALEKGESTGQLPKQLILITPASSTGPEPSIRLVGRFLRNAARRFFVSPESRRSFLQRYRGSQTTGAKPGAMVQEIQGMADTSIWPDLAFLKNQGVSVGIIAGEDDKVFHATSLEKRAREIGIPVVTASIPHDGVYVKTQEVMQAIHKVWEEFSPQ